MCRRRIDDRCEILDKDCPFEGEEQTWCDSYEEGLDSYDIADLRYHEKKEN